MWDTMTNFDCTPFIVMDIPIPIPTTEHTALVIVGLDSLHRGKSPGPPTEAKPDLGSRSAPSKKVRTKTKSVR
eukprot:398180-Prorocentrum_minimum.AAC.1